MYTGIIGVQDHNEKVTDVKELAPQFKVKPLPPRTFTKQFHPQQRENQQGSMAVEEEMQDEF